MEQNIGAFKDVADNVQIAVAGGIDKHALQHMKEPLPDIAIVGSYITGSSNRREAAMDIQYLMNR
jgi:3-keto-L-gulonate-6-phosphate decarboxylase